MSSPEPNNLMLCIVCMTMKPRRTSGGEHVIPYALGGSLTIDRVCVDCDNRLGNTADAGLINLSSIEQKRYELRLASQNRTIPDPKRAAMKMPFVEEGNPKHRVYEVEDSTTGGTLMKTAPTVEFKVTEEAGGLLIEPRHVYIDPSDIHKAEVLAKSALRKEGITDNATIERIAKEFAASLQLVESKEKLTRTVERRVGGHENGLLKIAYEFTWHLLGDSWLSSAEAIAMREMLAGEKPSSRVGGKIYSDADATIMVKNGDPRLFHVVWLWRFENRLLLYVRLFNALSAGFDVADARAYAVPKNNAVVMHTVQRQCDETEIAMKANTVAWTHDASRSRFS